MKNRFAILLVFGIFVLLVANLISNTKAQSVIGPAKPSINFTASPPTITNGNSSTLTWSSPTASACKGPGDWFYPLLGGNTSGSKVVSPGKTTEYSVTCKDSTSENTSYTKVFVNYTQSAHDYTIDIKVTNVFINGTEIIGTPTDGPITITASPDDSLRIRTEVKITDTNGLWPNLPLVNCVDWTSGSIINFDGTYTDSTRKVNVWTNNNTYNPIMLNTGCDFQLADDRIIDSVSVKINPPAGPPTHLDCVSNVCSRVSGLGPDSCFGGEGSACGGGGPCVPTWSPATNTVCSGKSFTQTSSCDGTTRTSTGTKSCIAPTPPTVNIKLNGADGSVPIINGASGTVSWTSTNATTCAASGSGWSGAKSTSGSESTGVLTFSKDYVLTCTGSGGSSSDSVTAAVTYPGGGPFVDIKAQ
jgi:hypothetical protein